MSDVRVRAKQGVSLDSKELSDLIVDALNDYTDEIKEGMSVIAEEISQASAEELKHSGSFGGKGVYRANWTSTDNSNNKRVRKIAHNKKTYRLTHLLEYGHLTKDGKTKTRAFEHIYPINTKAQREFEKRIKDLIKNGGLK